MVCKLEVGRILETPGEPRAAEDGAVPRSQCKVLASGEDGPQEGWVTVKGNQGTKYLDEVTPFSEFCKELDTTLAAIAKTNGKIKAFFLSKQKELGAAPKESPLVSAKEEMAKFQT